MRSVFVRSATWITLFTFITGSCGGRAPKQRTTITGGPSPISDQVLVQTKNLPKGLDMRVSDGRQGKPAFDRAQLAPATRLSDADAEALLSRVKPLQADAADKQAFALRPKSQPPPRTGNVIKASFPPPASAGLPPARVIDAGKDLRVLRYMPEGKVPLAPDR